MKKILLTSENYDEVVEEALTVIKNGGVIVAPSETVYGLSADASSESGVTKTYKIKQMNSRKPIGLVAGTVDLIKENFVLNSLEEHLIQSFWPGPLGLRLKVIASDRTKRIAELTLGETYDPVKLENNKKVIRVTSHPFLADISNKLGGPIISTSANITGHPACSDIPSVILQLKDQDVQPDLIIDAGKLPESQPSTMIDATEEPCKVIRAGADWEAVERVIEQVQV